MKLLTKELRAALPAPRAQENSKDPIVHVKFFTPDANATWLATEFDGEDEFFGYVCLGDHEMGELGYFSLSELESLRGPMGLPVERDLHWTPKGLYSVAMKFLCGGAHQ